MSTEAQKSQPIQMQSAEAAPRQTFKGLEQAISEAQSAHRRVNELTATSPLAPSFWIQKLVRRSLAWYTRPMQLFQRAVISALQSIRETALDAQQNLQDQIRQLQATHISLAQQHASLSDQVALLRRATKMTSSSNLLRENDRIVDYWNQAAAKDPMRETVTQGATESDEEYQENWRNIGNYVSGKIMSYSVPKPVALEIGPGMGRITVPMSPYCKSITALDISPLMAARAQEITASLGNVEVKVITDEDLSFLPAAHFDLAYSISCFQHADKKSFYRYLEGMHRALKPGGVLFFGVLNPCSEHGWGHFAAIVRNDYPEFFHTPDEISTYLKRAGYSSFQLQEEGETLWAIARR